MKYSEEVIMKLKDFHFDDDVALLKIAKSRNIDNAIRREMFPLISDQSLLKDLFYASDDLFVRAYSGIFINDEDMIRDFLFSNSDDAVVVFLPLNPNLSESFLIEVVKSDLNDRCKENAVRNINFTNQDYCSDLALNESDEGIRKAAIAKLEDEKILKDLALNDSNLNVRVEASKKLNDVSFFDQFMDIGFWFDSISSSFDDSILGYFVLNADDLFIKSRACRKITDEDVLTDIVLNSWYYESDREWSSRIMPPTIPENAFYLKQLAIEKITLESNFIRIAKEINVEDEDDGSRLGFSRIYVMKASVGGITDYAIERIEDQQALCDIAYNAPLLKTRTGAARKIKDSSVLHDLAFNDDDEIRSSVLKNPNVPEDILKEVILNETEMWMICRAIRNPNLVDNSFLKEIVLKDYGEDVSNQAICKITDEAILKELFRSSPSDANIRSSCVSNPNLRDAGFLEDVAKNDGNFRVRLEAVENPSFTDNNILKTIACEDESEPVAHHAILKIDDNDMLVDLLSQTDNDFLREKIAGNPSLTDEDVLKNIILNDESSDVRFAAIENPNFNDENLLKDIIKDESDKWVLQSALGKIWDDEVLLKFLGTDFAYVACHNISDENILRDIIENSEDESLKFAVCNNPNLKDNAVLGHLIRSSSYTYLAREACRCIRDEEVLKDVVLNHYNENFRLCACGNPNLKDISVLCNVIRRDPNSYVRNAAFGRIKELVSGD